MKTKFLFESKDNDFTFISNNEIELLEELTLFYSNKYKCNMAGKIYFGCYDKVYVDNVYVGLISKI